jgi:hypothetical protein
LLGAALHDALAGHYVSEGVRIRRLRSDLGRTEAERGGVSTDAGLEGLELRGELVVVLGDVV